MMIFSFIVALVTAPLYFHYYVKWIIAYIVIRISSFYRNKRFELYDIYATGDPVKLGFIVPQSEKEFESPYPDYHLQEATDEVLIYGVNSRNECLLTRIARGPDQVADAWIYLKLSNGKIYCLSENIGNQQPYEGECFTFSCGKLLMHYLLPMRRWRIFYCGMLKEISPDKKDCEEMVFVKFVFQWTASSDVYDPSLDTNAREFTSAMTRAHWKTPFIPPVTQLKNALNFYAQGGIVTGTVSVKEEADYEMYLFGEKLRNISKCVNNIGCKFTNILGNVPTNGFNFHLGKACIPNTFQDLSYGFVVQPSGDLETIKEVEFMIKSGQEKLNTNFEATFSSIQIHKVRGNVRSDPIVLYSGLGWSGYLELSFIEFEIGNTKGSGLMLAGEVLNEHKKAPNLPAVTSFPKSIPLTLQLTNEISEFGKISGGKGSSLSKMIRLSHELQNDSEVPCFCVPSGIVVTIAAYDEFLTPQILSEIKKLEDVLYGNVVGDIKEACNSVSNVIQKTLLPHKVCNCIIHDLKEIFGEEVNSRKFAIRSSSTGEDTSTMSAAGQMDTFLGVQGFKEILKSVKMCWASQFGHIAVEYKRRYGQILNSPMAVVVQEMVASEVSGVLFTCDPVTNNPSIITITANYGLGETVVSGAVEPDTIKLIRKNNNELLLHSIVVGKKLQKTVMMESGGTFTEDVPEEFQRDCCIFVESAKSLGRLAIKIEDFHRSTRDIEWGIKDKKIYIFQSRPVTNIAAETEFEIKHELDAPLRCENEYFTKANIGEVLPGATSPLGIELSIKYFGNVMKRTALDKGFSDSFMSSRYYATGLLPFCNHVLMSVAALLTRYVMDSPESKGMMVSVFGRVLDDPELLEYARERAGDPAPQSLRSRFCYYRDLFFHDLQIDAFKKKLDKYQPKFLNYDTATETFAAILKSCSDFDESGIKHMNSSESSSNWNNHIFTVLTKSQKEMNNDLYCDLSKLLSTSLAVESADIPQAMNDVAFQIKADLGSEKFGSMTVEEAERWLQSSTTTSGLNFRKFLMRHGHRCLKEFDPRTTTWGMDSKPLVKLLMKMVETSTESTVKVDDYSRLFSELHVPLSLWSKCLLRFMLPHCRRAIKGREAGKSLTIKSVDYWRQGFRRLSKQMVAEGRIPNDDLIYFMVFDEINDLLKTRSPSIIARASYRQRLYPTLDSFLFPEIMKGIPKPINESYQSYEFETDLMMKGIPVSQGIAKGFARVAVSLEQANRLRAGEILITYCTDIGWSPYFPIVSGVVTEIGGLISHGAVVSREYGLPCVVGIQGVTSKFQTGDYVLLDGRKGTLQRLSQPEQNNSML